MKVIIQGRRYDTEAPRTELVAENYSPLPVTDLAFWSERLYRTSHGNWFVQGEGGPMTRWARTVGQNSWSSGCGIRPLSDEAALEWLEYAGETEAIETYFEVEEA